MAKGIKKISAVKKQRITDLTVSSISTGPRLDARRRPPPALITICSR